jgi:DNA repair protein RadC
MKPKLHSPFNDTEQQVFALASQILSDAWEAREEKPVLTTPRDDDAPQADAAVIAACRKELVDYLRFSLVPLRREQSTAVLCDVYGRMIGMYTLDEGGERSCEMSMREIARLVTQHGAFSVLLCHNHPGGDCRPSDADLAVTAQAGVFLSMMDCVLLDHVVVAANGVASIARAMLTKRGTQAGDAESLAQCWA